MTDRIGTPGGTPERPALFFADAAEFGRWLERHHATETELWMGLYRKAHPDAGLQWPEAVREALCWGWIDSMAQGIDEHTRRQRWTPRKKGSNWSAVNIKAVAELTEAGRMRPAGLAAFAALVWYPILHYFSGASPCHSAPACCSPASGCSTPR